MRSVIIPEALQYSFSGRWSPLALRARPPSPTLQQRTPSAYPSPAHSPGFRRIVFNQDKEGIKKAVNEFATAYNIPRLEKQCREILGKSGGGAAASLRGVGGAEAKAGPEASEEGNWKVRAD